MSINKYFILYKFFLWNFTKLDLQYNWISTSNWLNWNHFELTNLTNCEKALNLNIKFLHKTNYKLKSKIFQIKKTWIQFECLCFWKYSSQKCLDFWKATLEYYETIAWNKIQNIKKSFLLFSFCFFSKLEGTKSIKKSEI